jgi:predicted membrane protein
MEARTTIRSVWLVHATVFALVGVLLLVRALPIDWDTPANLEYQEVWGSLAVAICVLALLIGSTEGVLWARGVRVGALLTCLIGAAFAFTGAGFLPRSSVRVRRRGLDSGARTGRHVPAGVVGVLGRPNVGRDGVVGAPGSTDPARHRLQP